MKTWLCNCFAVYRRVLYRLCRRPETGVLSSWSPCQVEDPNAEQTFGDVIHPCVRFVEGGFEGHRWWMVYTPLYGGNAKMENPRLCYSDAADEEVPTNWIYYCTVKDQPEIGYNSDPTLLFEGGRLFVYWRENYTPSTRSLGMSRATFGCYVENRQVHYLSEAQLLELNRNRDKEISPTFLSFRGTPRAYAVHSRFCSKMMYHLPAVLSRCVYRFLDYLEKLGFYSRFRCRGVSIWEGDSFEKAFRYLKTVRFQGVNLLYQPWHMDLFFSPDNKPGLYAVIQTSIHQPDICLAKSEDGERFRLYPLPLITEKTIRMTGLYKPSGVIVNNMFYLYFTACDNDNPRLNRLFVATIDWKDLLIRISREML